MRTSVILDSTVISEKNYFIMSHIKDVVATSLNEVNIICRNLSTKVVEPDCAIINPSEIYSFYDGILIATSMSSAESLCKSCVNSRKLFYIWDIGFLYRPFEFHKVCNILSSLELITRSEEHRRIIYNLCGETSHILEDFNLEEIWNLPKSTRTA